MAQLTGPQTLALQMDKMTPRLAQTLAEALTNPPLTMLLQMALMRKPKQMRRRPQMSS